MPAVDDVRTHLLPRPGKPPRLIAELSPRDAAAWRAAGRRIAGAARPRRAEGVHATAGCLIDGPPGDRRLRALLGAARASARHLSEAGPVLRTDVRAFYPSLGCEAVHRGLLAGGAGPPDAREAADLVRGWEDRGHAGLPIGPPASAAVADAILLPVDEVLEGRPFLRWVDDYLIPVHSPEDAERVLERIDERLAWLGLERSEVKTRLVPAGRLGAWPGSLSPAEVLSRRGGRGASGAEPRAARDAAGSGR